MINGLPEKLRELRLTHNFSQKQLAAALKVSPSLISSYETGERMPSIENLKSLAQFYHCTTDYLLGLPSDTSCAILDVSHLSSSQISALHTIVDGLSSSSLK